MKLKLHGVTSDGAPNPQPIALVVRDPETGQEYRDEHGVPAVSMTLRAVSKDEHQRLIAQHTKRQRDLNGTWGEVTDWVAVNDGIVTAAVQSWNGIIGADDQPLACVPATIAALDFRVKEQVVKKLFGAEVVESTQASFRQS